ncbi:MAG: RNA 2',3'-cyclic phosphodiesterase [Pseudomonadota bacterium]|nr:RNA 2',3'-cyclic phosphodiesterase [Pseudomonadota bacterium]
MRIALADISRQAHTHFGGRPTHAESLHMTLAFLGAVPEKRIDELRATAAEVRFARFVLDLDSIGCWRHNHIAWIAPRTAPPELSDLVAQLEARLASSGFSFDLRLFAPHVTLARKADCKPGLSNFAAPGWQVDEFVLVESAAEHLGGTYRIIGRWRCG